MARSPASAPPLIEPVVTASPGTARPERRPSRLWSALRHGLPVAGVIAVVVLVAVIAYFVYDSNRRGALNLSNDLIAALDRRVAVQMQAYLEPAQEFLLLADAAAGGRDVFDGAQQVQQFALRGLHTAPPITAFSYADPEGNFLFVIRNHKGGYDTKTVDRRSGGHTVTWTRRDADGKTIAVETDPADTFDPRTRPWYEGAESTRKPFWTDTYLFFTLQKPGVTYSIPHFDSEGKLQTVMAVDIELATLCSFLKKLSIGTSGKALIIDHDGRVVAYPSDDWLPASNKEIKAPLLDELGDPVLSRAFSVLRVEGYGRRVLQFENRRIIVSSSPAGMMAENRWVVLIVVPETDFLGFVTDSGLAALVMSILVVLIVAALSGLLAWRSVAAERRAAAAATREQALETRTQTFIELARGAEATGGEEYQSLEDAAEAAAMACAAKRVSLWRLTPDRSTLLCEDCYDQTAHDHTTGMELHRDQLPDLFAALGNGAPIDTPDAAHDRRTAELFQTYLAPLEINNVYIAPIMARGRLMGMLAVEDPERGDQAAGLVPFCDALAVVLALRFAQSAPVPAAPRAEAVAAAIGSGLSGTGGGTMGGTGSGAAAPLESFAQRQSQLERTLLQQNCTLDELGESAIDLAAIGVLRLPDWTAIAQPPPDSAERTAMDAIVRELGRTIDKSGLSYAALLDNEIVLAAFSAEKAAVAGNAFCVATALLDLRDRLVRLEERWNTSLDFRLGVDVGTVMSSIVGTDPPSRNLWGGAVGIAKVLAGTAARRTIFASETAYDSLSDKFLFRPRGSYFLPETGTMRTFVLVSRI
jgi:adenylate cyclase